ncbi:myosin light chain kinase, smooth muscle-like [Penaeus monodon]|uniref:myosin light chain kinase, smooth muscle-like n=1 Tax=Penaeus monodon TaxID=6687 RepID=UPI0018A73AEC|nr:myosin light chain kinase, smooth muscle-like [Penaeus monodon]
MDAPENILTEEQVNADRGTKVTLQCSAEGNPTPKLTWSRKPPTPNSVCLIDIEISTERTFPAREDMYSEAAAGRRLRVITALRTLSTGELCLAFIDMAVTRERVENSSRRTESKCLPHAFAFVSYPSERIIDILDEHNMPLHVDKVNEVSKAKLISKHDSRKTEESTQNESTEQIISKGVGVAKLSIGSASRADTGVYLCRASNLVGVSEPAATRVVVTQKVMSANDVGGSRETWAVLGGIGRLECYVRAAPQPSFVWSRNDGLTLLNSGKYTIHETKNLD